MHFANRPFPMPAMLMALIPTLVVTLIFALVPEPKRLRIAALSAAGFTTLYLNGGFGAWEFVYMLAASVPAYYAQKSYQAVGLCWLMHGAWDLTHHLFGNTLWLWDPSSSLGCAVMDPIVALYFFAGAPSLAKLRLRTFGETSA